MSNQNLKTIVAQGLSDMKSGSEIAAKATDEISKAASHPSLKERLEAGNKVSKQWAERIDRALQQVGSQGQQENTVLKALYGKYRETMQKAPDDTSRDLGIVSCGQVGLHYWITTFSTTAAYAKQLGMDDVARDMKTSADEAKMADEQHTDIAEQLLQD